MQNIENIVREIARQEIASRESERVTQALRTVVVHRVSEHTHYSVRTVAELLEVSLDYVYDKINAGRIKTVELGDGRSKQRIPATELARFVNDRSSRTVN